MERRVKPALTSKYAFRVERSRKRFEIGRLRVFSLLLNTKTNPSYPHTAGTGIQYELGAFRRNNVPIGF